MEMFNAKKHTLDEEESVFFPFVRNPILSTNLKRSVYALHFNYFRQRET